MGTKKEGAPEKCSTQQKWDALAAVFDQHHNDHGDQLRQKFYDPAMLHLIGDISGQIVLDAGCGNGYFAEILAESATTVIGVDFSPRMVSFAKTRSKHPNIKLILADVQRLPLFDRSIDIAVSNLVLQYVPSLEKPATELQRVIKDNGKVLIGVEHPMTNVIYRTQELLGSRRTNDFEHAVDYFDRKPTVRRTLNGEANVIVFNRPLEGYLQPFLHNGFVLSNLAEPPITEDIVNLHPSYQRIRHGARFIIFEFTKR